MKKIIASASLTALGAFSLHAAEPGLLSPQEKSKIWTVGLDVSGFYDSNYNAAPSAQSQGSWGIEIIPSVGINLLLDQTVIGLTGTYDMRWYADRPDNSIDQSVIFDLNVSHSFSESMNLSLVDRFVYADEPDVLDQGGIITTPTLLRSEQSAYHNLASVAFSYDFNPRYGIEVSLSNGWYDYQQSGPGSLSALMNRLDNKAGLNLRWYAAPPTTVLIGYQYEWLDYTSSESLNQFSSPNPLYVNPNVRNYNSSFIYAGVDHNFTSELSTSLRLGAQITDYTKLQDYYPNQDDGQITPYADFSVNWVYNPGSYVKVGVRSTLNSTDVAYVNSAYPVLNQQSTAAYGTWSHRLTPRLTGTLVGLFQASEYNGQGSPVDGETDYLGIVGVNLNYMINTFLSADAGYNYDRLDSDIPGRSYTRNRVYFGLSAKY